MRYFLGLLFILFFNKIQGQNLRRLSNTSFKKGENLHYRAHYGLIKAGEFILRVEDTLAEINKRKCYFIRAEGHSTGAVDLFFPVNDIYQSYVDTSAILPLKFYRNVKEGKYRKIENALFDHHNDVVHTDISKIKVPDNLQDVVSAYYYSRCINTSNFKPGDIIPISAFIDNEVIPFNLKFAGTEEIKTKLGKFRCLIFKPQLQIGRVFSEEEGMTIWVSDDANHLPVKVEAKLLVGSLKMELDNMSGLANPPAAIIK